jgi:DICT domain-containing protein
VRDISIFEHAAELAAVAQAENLGTIHHLSRRDFVERRSVAFRCQTPCLEYVSLLIESALLLRTNRTGRVYVGFEKLSRMEPVADRYLRIADVSERVFVFGEMDWKPPRHPHLRPIAISNPMKLANEWFVIADSSTLRVALIARGESGVDALNPDRRYFTSIKTSDSAIVSKLAAAAEKIVSELQGESHPEQ